MFSKLLLTEVVKNGRFFAQKVSMAMVSINFIYQQKQLMNQVDEAITLASCI
jgi:hypothetical protein